MCKLPVLSKPVFPGGERLFTSPAVSVATLALREACENTDTHLSTAFYWKLHAPHSTDQMDNMPCITDHLCRRPQGGGSSFGWAAGDRTRLLHRVRASGEGVWRPRRS